MRKWRSEDSEELYDITGWGTSYFSINDKGHVEVTPRKDGVEVDLKELVDELQLRDVAAPMLVRVPDILDLSLIHIFLHFAVLSPFVYHGFDFLFSHFFFSCVDMQQVEDK